MKIRFIDRVTDFGKGVLAGFLLAAILFGVVVGMILHRQKVKEIMEYVELQQEIEALREDVINLTTDELLDLPDIRGAADGAIEDFIRKRDEVLQRFRDRFAD